jgi:streptomycin 6-kinase
VKLRRLPGSGRAFVVDLDDGRRFKARVLPRGAAPRVFRLLARLRAGDLPRPLARDGRVLAVEYVPGRRLDALLASGAAEPARAAREAGGLLARLHATPVPSRETALPLAAYRALLRRTVRRLRARSRLGEADAGVLLAIEAPRRVRFAITHGDLYPENLVRAPRGRLRAIDEERLAVRPAPFDLARCVTRWPMDHRLEAVLLRGYAAGGGDARPYLRDRAFWLAVAWALSAAFRMKDRRRPLRVPVAGLRDLAREIAAG